MSLSSGVGSLLSVLEGDDAEVSISLDGIVGIGGGGAERKGWYVDAGAALETARLRPNDGFDAVTR
jgi:hypothetical protein